jgi:uncharacterized protein YbbC (DUF1343 family)
MRLKSIVDAFHKNPEINLKAVFGPEHGIRGEVQDALEVPFQRDPYTGLPVYSLYGTHHAPTEEMLDGVDTLVFDIQDCGARYYTYISTLTLCMESSKEYGVKLMVLDRPNPINGSTVEGNILEEAYKSFIGLHRIPIRHGLTIGEAASLINTEIGCNLDIIPVKGWKRKQWYDETGLPWVQPSPNLPSLDTATVYPGTCLFEGVNVSEGRGTTRPFEYLGAPWIHGGEWANALNKLNLPGVLFRRCQFTPISFQYMDMNCNGVQVHVTNRDLYRSVETGLHLLSTLIETHPKKFRFNNPTYDSRRHFDLLAGTDKLRNQLERREPVETILESWKIEIIKYLRLRESHLLYKEDKG